MTVARLGNMEKAILKTLVYADIFDYPLKVWEIHKWLIGKKASLPEVEKVLKRKGLTSCIKNQGDYYYLRGRKKIVEQRLAKERQSQRLMRQATFIARLFKLVPGVLLVGVSGNLAMENAGRFDDIDLFIITRKGSLWTVRAALLGILSFLDKRRARGEQKELAAGKICLNLLVEEDNLVQKNKDLYTAHEVLQMKVLWQRGKIYQKFLEENDWAFRFLPNWVGGSFALRAVIPLKKGIYRSSIKSRMTIKDPGQVRMTVEQIARFFQLRYMGKPSGKERIGKGELYFHPEDYRDKVLTEFRKKCAKMEYR
jgi:hypothetical protein